MRIKLANENGRTLNCSATQLSLPKPDREVEYSDYHYTFTLHGTLKNEEIKFAFIAIQIGRERFSSSTCQNGRDSLVVTRREI